jgi:hypothetical protein
MFLSDADYMVLRERQKDFVREAEQERLARSVTQAPSAKGRVALQRIAGIGGQLVRLGWMLQQYGAMQPSSHAGNR